MDIGQVQCPLDLHPRGPPSVGQQREATAHPYAGRLSCLSVAGLGVPLGGVACSPAMPDIRPTRWVLRPSLLQGLSRKIIIHLTCFAVNPFSKRFWTPDRTGQDRTNANCPTDPSTVQRTAIRPEPLTPKQVRVFRFEMAPVAAKLWKVQVSSPGTKRRWKYQFSLAPISGVLPPLCRVTPNEYLPSLTPAVQ